MEEEIMYNKIYARANADGIVVHIFSQAFETPLETDVCIDETNTDRHAAQKYPVMDEKGLYNYEIKSGVFRERDKTVDLEKLKEAELDAKYIPNKMDSLIAFAKAYLKENTPKTVIMKLSVSGLYDTWAAGKYEVGDIRNYAGQTWECIQAHDNAVYPDITPDNLQTWHTFWKPLHGKSAETARPWVKPQFGTTDMYHAGEYMIYTDGKKQFGTTDMYLAGEYMIYTDGKRYKCLSDTVYSPEEYAQAWEVQE